MRKRKMMPKWMLAAKKGKKNKPWACRITLKKLPAERARNTPKRVKGETQEAFGLMEFLCVLFRNNEELPNYKRLTDESITAILLSEFPKSRLVQRLKEGKITVGYFRSQYNYGQYTSGEKPKVRSLRYTTGGRVANQYTGRALNENGGLKAGVRSSRTKWKPEGGPLEQAT